MSLYLKEKFESLLYFKKDGVDVAEAKRNYVSEFFTK